MNSQLEPLYLVCPWLRLTPGMYRASMASCHEGYAIDCGRHEVNSLV